MEPMRWPAGAPQRYNPNDSTNLWPMYGLDINGKYLEAGAFTDIDDCPSKTFIIENYSKPDISRFFELSNGKRPEFELYNVKDDPYCLNNLAGNKDLTSIETYLKEKLIAELKSTNDPRIVGPDKEIFDSYKRYSVMRKFPKPEYLE